MATKTQKPKSSTSNPAIANIGSNGTHHSRNGSQHAYQLYQDLRSAIAGEVRFDEGSRALYATDASNYRQVPIGVVIPVSEQDIIETIRAMPQAQRSDTIAWRRHQPCR